MSIRFFMASLFLFTLSPRLLMAGQPVVLSRSIAAEQLHAMPSVVSVAFFGSKEAADPLQVRVFEKGEWQSNVPAEDWPPADNKEVSFQVRFEKPDNLLSPLWVEMKADEVSLGKRSLLAPTPPNMTVHGEIRSNTAFVFPDNSRQTTAAKSSSLNTLLTASCAAGSSIRTINADGSVVCEVDDNSGGTVTEIRTGTGLTGGPVSSSGTLSVAVGGISSTEIRDATISDADIDTSKVQKRVTGTCPSDHILNGINADGSVICTSIYMAIPTLPVSLYVVDDSENAGKFVSMAIGQDGNPVMSYWDLSNNSLKVAKCNDPDCSGGDETITTVDSSARVGLYTSIAISTDGNPVISYYDETNKDLKVAKCNDPACSGNDETIAVVDATNDVGSETSIAIGNDGYPVISYADSTNDVLKVAKCNDPACTGGGEILSTVASSGYVTNAIAISNDGNPVIAFYVWPGSDLYVVKCNDVACSGNDEVSYAVDTIGDTGRSPSIAIGADGNPVISYWGTDMHGLQVAKCNDPACNPAVNGAELVSIVDDAETNTGWGSSLAIGDDGNPVISYYAQPSQNLKVAKCNDPACAGGNELITTIDAIGDVGGSASLALGNDGNPVIGYWDRTNGNLKVAKCHRPGCN